jgi:hypothetical protein
VQGWPDTDQPHKCAVKPPWVIKHRNVPKLLIKLREEIREAEQ